VTVTVLSQQADFRQTRAVTADIVPEPLSEFAWFQEENLRFGSGVVLTGKVYSGAASTSTCIPSEASSAGTSTPRVPSADQRLRHPDLRRWGQAYDGYGDFNDIRDVYPEPLDFERFWDDLDLIEKWPAAAAGSA